MSVVPGSGVHCPHAPPCPGCPLIALSYDEQLAIKRERAEKALSGFYELAPCPVAATAPADPVVDYRVRTKLVVDGARIGLFARGEHRVIDIPGCRVMDPAIRLVADGVRRLLPLAVPLRALDLRRVESGVFATLVVPESASDADVTRAAERVARDVPGLASVAVSRRDEESHQVLGRAPTVLSGVHRAEIPVAPGGPFHYAGPGGFAQAHPQQQRALFAAIFAAVDRAAPSTGPRVLELFAGSGALALALVSRGCRVVAVESFEPAARLAREAAKTQGLALTVEAADAADVARALTLAGECFDVVIVNPPRRGLTPALRADLAALAPAELIYVSCEPATLARDLADFARRGYALRAVRPFDMMPLTEEVETLAVLGVGADLPAPEVLYEDERLITVSKAPHEPTIRQGPEIHSLLDRVRALPGGEHAVPVHRMDLGTSGVCLFARKPAYLDPLFRAFTAGEKRYTAVVRGITRDKGSVRRPLPERGRPLPSRTRYERSEVVSGHSLVTVRPEEGRKHQIRKHFASIGHPVVGDARYGDARTNHHFQMRHFLDRPFLHCSQVRLVLGERETVLSAKLAPDLALVLESLRATETQR